VRDTAPRTYVFWVHASTRVRFEEAYRRLADRLELPGRLDPKADVLRLVSDWLCDETNGQWTIVLDNADDVETFFPSRRREQDGTIESSLAAYLPQSRNGSILITSRSRDAAAKLAGGYHNIKEVLTMDKSQGLQLLRNKLPPMSHKEGTEEGAMVELLQTLDYMPLAITQAAAYISRRARMTIAGYLDEFRANDERRESLLNQDSGDLRRDESASNSVVTTWQMSFERIRQERPSAAELLSLMSFFNTQGIPEKTLRGYNWTAAGAGVSNDKSRADNTFDEDLDTLHAYCLVTMTTAVDNEMWEMHPLVQFCTRAWLSSFGEAERWKGKFVELLAQEFPNGEFENWTQCQQLLPHAEPLYDTEPASEQLLNAWAQVLTNVAWYLWMRGSFKIAQTLVEKAVTARERALGPVNQHTLVSIEILALVLRYQGKYDEAEKLNRRALEGNERELGVYHPNTLTSVGNLALILQYQGKYDEAEKLNRRALEGRERELGVYHPDTLTSVGNLALILQYQGKYDESEKLNRRALGGNERELGVYHPNTLTSVSNLALVLQDQGKYDEAEKLNRRALEGRERELGVYHPDTLTSVGNLALILQYQGKYDESEKLNRRALEGRERELGVFHPDTPTIMNNLASVLQDQGKYDEAEKLNRRALEGREKELGTHHPDTLTSTYYLAHLLHAMEQYAEAAELYERAYNGRVQKLGHQHPHTIACRNHFLALQQEVEQPRLGDNQDSALPVHGDEAIVKTTHTKSVFAQTTSKRKEKQDSFLARIRVRMRRKDR